MGKKTKKPSGGGEDAASSPAKRGPSSRSDAHLETAEDLHFEDPFEDVYEDEDVFVREHSDDEDDGAMAVDALAKTNDAGTKPWMPGSEGGGGGPSALEYDPTAYKLHHGLTAEWPALSFDFLRDGLGTGRVRPPHSVTCVFGTQGASAKDSLTVMRLSELHGTNVQGEENLEEEEEEDSDEEGDADVDPVVEHASYRHDGPTNRVRSMDGSSIVAVWGEKGSVSVYDVAPLVATFDGGGGTGTAPAPMANDGVTRRGRPLQVHLGHGREGYALDWSRKVKGRMATGDVGGGVHLWEMEGGSGGTSFAVTPAYAAKHSIEDIQWSPTEDTVFAAAECSSGKIHIFDIRKKGAAMISHVAHKGTDVNVIAWNHKVANLLASGSDDGVFSVWDLRSFGKSDPLARFASHRKPITSVQWHPTDESMAVVSDEDATYVYDLSVEEDAEEEAKTNKNGETGDIPPQLLFVHCGSSDTKEAHWHPQIPSLVMTTAASGFSVFIPSNL